MHLVCLLLLLLSVAPAAQSATATLLWEPLKLPPGDQTGFMVQVCDTDQRQPCPMADLLTTLLPRTQRWVSVDLGGIAQGMVRCFRVLTVIEGQRSLSPYAMCFPKAEDP